MQIFGIRHSVPVYRECPSMSSMRLWARAKGRKFFAVFAYVYDSTYSSASNMLRLFEQRANRVPIELPNRPPVDIAKKNNVVTVALRK